MAGRGRLHGRGAPDTPEELRRAQEVAELRLALKAAEGVPSAHELRRLRRRIRRLSRELAALIEA